jgi:hypothetical protein
LDIDSLLVIFSAVINQHIQFPFPPNLEKKPFYIIWTPS